MKGAIMSSSPSGMTKKWQVPEAIKLSFQPGPGSTPGWGPVGLGVCPSASASMALASSTLVLACWYKTMAIGEMEKEEWDATSLIKVGMMGKV